MMPLKKFHQLSVKDLSSIITEKQDKIKVDLKTKIHFDIDILNNDDTEYICDICHIKFKNKTNLKRHLGLVPSRSSNPKMQCYQKILNNCLTKNGIGTNNETQMGCNVMELRLRLAKFEDKNCKQCHFRNIRHNSAVSSKPHNISNHTYLIFEKENEKDLHHPPPPCCFIATEQSENNFSEVSKVLNLNGFETNSSSIFSTRTFEKYFQLKKTNRKLENKITKKINVSKIKTKKLLCGSYIYNPKNVKRKWNLRCTFKNCDQKRQNNLFCKVHGKILKHGKVHFGKIQKIDEVDDIDDDDNDDDDHEYVSNSIFKWPVKKVKILKTSKEDEISNFNFKPKSQNVEQIEIKNFLKQNKFRTIILKNKKEKIQKKKTTQKNEPSLSFNF